MKPIYLSVAIIGSSFFAVTGYASAIKPKPGQVSTFCGFTKGEKAGQIVDLKELANPVLLGKPCDDKAGNRGISVLSPAEMAKMEAEEAEEEAAKTVNVAEPATQILANTCKFTKGPRVGETENYQGKLPAAAIGSVCTDGLRSAGVMVAD